MPSLSSEKWDHFLHQKMPNLLNEYLRCRLDKLKVENGMYENSKNIKKIRKNACFSSHTCTSIELGIFDQ